MKTEETSKAKYEVKYVIAVPGGNDTALVYGTDYTPEQKKKINDAIMAKHSNVEQVGFVDPNKKPELQMAGGEFCGNATRSAAYLYLGGQKGEMQIIVNSEDLINAGVFDGGKAWCEIPLYHGKDVITTKEPGIFIVKMNGMVSVVIKPEVAKRYLNDTSLLKQYGMEFIHKYHLEESEAVGVMFCENIGPKLKINPVVWVKAINTLFYETACGSGTTATCMVEAYESGESKKIDILQPSGLTITAEITFENNQVTKAVISGDVVFDKKEYFLEIN